MGIGVCKIEYLHFRGRACERTLTIMKPGSRDSFTNGHSGQDDLELFSKWAIIHECYDMVYGVR